MLSGKTDSDTLAPLVARPPGLGPQASRRANGQHEHDEHRGGHGKRDDHTDEMSRRAGTG